LEAHVGIRIRLPGVALAIIGVAGMALVYFFREGWAWTEMGALAVVAVVGIARTARGS
jgi:hypothetical protein